MIVPETQLDAGERSDDEMSIDEIRRAGHTVGFRPFRRARTGIKTPPTDLATLCARTTRAQWRKINVWRQHNTFSRV